MCLTTKTNAIHLYGKFIFMGYANMNKKFKNKYRSESIRLQGYDYSTEGIYFITICTQNRIPYFGQIKDGRMILSDAGEITTSAWLQTSKIRERVVLGEWIVMPNHFHAIIYLKPKNNPRRDASHASPILPVANPSHASDYKNEFGPQRNNISSIIRGFKSTCTRQIRQTGVKGFGWQRGFYDHIVRNQKALLRIEQYIRENPRNWTQDNHFKSN